MEALTKYAIEKLEDHGMNLSPDESNELKMNLGIEKNFAFEIRDYLNRHHGGAWNVVVGEKENLLVTLGTVKSLEEKLELVVGNYKIVGFQYKPLKTQ